MREKVGKDKFLPSPNVDSVILKIDFNRPRVEREWELLFFDVVRACFFSKKKNRSEQPDPFSERQRKGRGSPSKIRYRSGKARRRTGKRRISSVESKYPKHPMNFFIGYIGDSI